MVMNTRYFALIAGIVYAAVGLLGFIPGLRTAPPPGAPELNVSAGYGLLFGLFPINVVHNIVHLALGIWGIVAYASFPAARRYAQGLAVIYGVLAVLGFFPVLNTLFGLAPLFGHDIWLHALTAIVAAYFGFRAPAMVERVEAERPRRAA
jgi:hypothetical protein